MTINYETGEMVGAINYEIHPAANLFPLIEGEAFRAFVEDIKVRGQEVPVVLDKAGRLLDGRNRARACQSLGIDVKETRYAGDDPFGFVISHNMQRRHLTESQRAMVAAKLATMRNGGDRRSESFSGSIDPLKTVSTEDAAAALNVSPTSVKRAKSVRDHGTDEEKAAVESGELSVSAAAKAIKERQEPQEPRSVNPKPSKRPGRDEKADLLADLARQGYSAEQMASKLGLSRSDQVRELARERDINIPADHAVGKRQRLNSNRILSGVVDSLEVAALSLQQVNPLDLDQDSAQEWVDSLTESLTALRKAANSIKESLHV